MDDARPRTRRPRRKTHRQAPHERRIQGRQRDYHESMRHEALARSNLSAFIAAFRRSISTPTNSSGEGETGRATATFGHGKATRLGEDISNYSASSVPPIPSGVSQHGTENTTRRRSAGLDCSARHATSTAQCAFVLRQAEE